MRWLLNLILNSLMATKHPFLLVIKVSIDDFLTNLRDTAIRILLMNDPFLDLFVLSISLRPRFLCDILLSLLQSLRQLKLILRPHGTSPDSYEPDEYEHENIEHNLPEAQMIIASV